MKKLLTLVFVLCCSMLKAQYSNPQNSLAVVAGPNWVQKLNNFIIGRGNYSSNIGYTIGADYTCNIAPLCELKIGLRYNVLNTEYRTEWLRYESEYGPDGTYTPDPNLQHYFTEEYTDKVWQYIAGIRWIGKPKTWRWYADGETGLTNHIGAKNDWRFTVGAGFGLAWQPANSKMGVFAQPMVRYVFQSFSSDLAVANDFYFLIPAIEAGSRYYF